MALSLSGQTAVHVIVAWAVIGDRKDIADALQFDMEGIMLRGKARQSRTEDNDNSYKENMVGCARTFEGKI